VQDLAWLGIVERVGGLGLKERQALSTPAGDARIDPQQFAAP